MPNPRLFLFLALSFFSGLFEIGVIVWGLATSAEVYFPFLFALAYQVGALGSFKPPSRGVWWGLIVTTAAVGSVAAIGVIEGWAWTFLLVVLVSALINSSRVALGKAEISTTLKRCSRVLGFLAAPLLLIGWLPLSAVFAVVVLSVSAALATSRACDTEDTPPKRPGAAVIKLALVTHQMHYFSYCTVVIVTLLQNYPASVAVGVFVLGWASYIAVPHLIGSRMDPGQAALWGHLLLPLVLLALWFAPVAGSLWSLLWIATGFFGGTVVYLTRFSRQQYGLSEPQLALLENTGHCLGSALALAVVIAGWSSNGLLLIGAGFAAITAGLVATCLSTMPRLLTY